MKILMVTRPVGEPWNEGGKNLAYNLAKNIKNNKIILLTKYKFNEKLPENIISEKTFSSSNKRKISFFDKLRLFKRILKNDDIDLYHIIFTPELYSSLILKNILKNKKSIQTIPTLINHKRFIKKLIFANKVVVLSDYSKNFLSEKGFDNIIKINPGINPDFFKPIKKDKELLSKLNLKDKFVVLNPCELEPKRGTKIFTRSILELSNIKDIFFIFSYRKDDNKKYLKEKKYIISILNKNNLSNFIFLEDFIDIRKLISISDLVVYPVLNMKEKQEIPMILLESLSMKKPIIITDILPLNEILKSNCGRKIDKYDYKQLSKFILNLKEDSKMIKKMGDNGRNMVLNNFNINKIAREYEKLYKSFDL